MPVHRDTTSLLLVTQNSNCFNLTMLTLPIKQSLRNLRHPLRNPLRNPLSGSLSNTLRTRHVSSWEAPFLGTASYAAMNERFSSYPRPLILFTEKKEKEAIERGEFVDIHDPSGPDPSHFDVLITDVDDCLLRSDISELIGIPYLKEATKDEANQMLETTSGLIYSRHSRLLFPCVVGVENKARWVSLL
jgi:hypothetical protein